MCQIQDYDGPPGDAEAGLHYFRNRFACIYERSTPAEAQDRELYIQLVLFFRIFPYINVTAA